jgi:hypothetical protein
MASIRDRLSRLESQHRPAVVVGPSRHWIVDGPALLPDGWHYPPIVRIGAWTPKIGEGDAAFLARFYREAPFGIYFVEREGVDYSDEANGIEVSPPAVITE